MGVYYAAGAKGLLCHIRSGIREANIPPSGRPADDGVTESALMIDWTDVDTVLLDMDGTLLDLHFDNYFWLKHLPRRYSDIHQLPAGHAQQKLEAMFEELRGSLNWYCLDYWSEKLALDIVALKQEVSHLIRIRPYVEDFLAALRRSGREVLLITNAHPDSLALKLDRVPIKPYFSAIVSSHDYALPKEDAGFWHCLQQAHPFDPGRTLFIDDSQAVLASAERYGIRYLLTLVQPDSQLAQREGLDYPGLLHFDELLPITGVKR